MRATSPPLLIVIATGLLTLLSPDPCLAQAGEASTREKLPLAKWSFAEDKSPEGAAPKPPTDADAWSMVQVPHVFRQSGLPDHTAGWYRQDFDLTANDQGKSVLLLLEGAASVKDVFVNGRHVGQHKGSFTAAAFDLTPAVKIGQPNRLEVRVTNRASEVANMLARPSLYYINGGMFRKAWLVKTGAVHIFPELGSCGVYLTPANVSAQRADLNVTTVVTNPLSNAADVKVTCRVSDPAGKQVAVFSATASVPAGAVQKIAASGAVSKPRLWDLLLASNLYTVRTELAVNGKASDCVTERTGFRTIEWKENRFLLNGREVQFRGVNKHTQEEYAWNAVSDDVLRQEWQWMSAMGVNAVRLAHYPHASLEYDLADAAGIAVWAENGYASSPAKAPSENDPFPEGMERVVTPDGERLTREMVLQNWNHPSILFWSCGNEVMNPTVADRYADVIRAEKDPNRLITYGSNGNPPTNCDFIAQNTYDGWYGGTYDGFKSALTSETGAGSWPSQHIPYGTAFWNVNKFEPEEYAQIFTEYRLQTICRTKVANHPMFFWWIFREFYDKKFKNNRNTKGLYTLAGAPKELSYLFQAFFRPSEPLVHLTGRHHFLRATPADNGIKAYANVAQLELTVNGVSQGKRKNGEYRIPTVTCEEKKKVEKNGVKTEAKIQKTIPGSRVDNVFFWNPTLVPGKNVVEVSDGSGHSERMVIHQLAPEGAMPSSPKALVQDLKSSEPGSPAYFIDRPVESQAPFYFDVDGSADNTFDKIPAPVAEASWIATRRLSDKAHKTDLSFRIHPASRGATVSVMFSTGTYPVVTLKQPSGEEVQAAAGLAQSLKASGFADTGEKAVWRNHDAERANALVFSRTVKPGETVTIPGHTLDYLVLVKKKP